jgi:hypothetical protein
VPLKPYRFAPEITLVSVNLSAMTIEALMDLRKRVDEMLRKHRAEIEQQLERMDRAYHSRGSDPGSRRASGKPRARGLGIRNMNYFPTAEAWVDDLRIA